MTGQLSPAEIPTLGSDFRNAFRVPARERAIAANRARARFRPASKRYDDGDGIDYSIKIDVDEIAAKVNGLFIVVDACLRYLGLFISFPFPALSRCLYREKPVPKLCPESDI